MSDEIARSRILIIGKANAGKTSILRKICGETDVPIVRDANGNRITDLETLDPTLNRGGHDIECEIIYPSRPGFAFHDSRGIEAGSTEEMDMVAKFIARRSKSPPKDRVHAAWICFPLDNARPLGEAEMRMLDLGPNPGDVPAVVVFTKYDGLESTTLNNLRHEGHLSLREAFRAMSGAAERLFKEHWLNRIYIVEPPKPPFVRLRDLHKPEGQCDALMKCTADVLKDNKPAQKLFVTAQKYDLEARLEYAIEDVVELLLNTTYYERRHALGMLVHRVLTWMPHVYRQVEHDTDLDYRKSCSTGVMESELQHGNFEAPDHIRSRIVQTLEYKGPTQALQAQTIIELIAGCIIVADHCFWITEQGDPEEAIKNPTAHKWSLRQGLERAMQAYRATRQEAVMNAVVRAFPKMDIQSLNLSLVAKMKLDMGKERERKVTELRKKLTEIVVEYRLPFHEQQIPQGVSKSTS